MKHFARLSENVVIETFTPLAGFELSDSFHPTIAEQFESVPIEVLVGWTRTAAGDWLPPQEDVREVPLPALAGQAQ